MPIVLGRFRKAIPWIASLVFLAFLVLPGLDSLFGLAPRVNLMAEFTATHFKGLSVRGLVLSGYPAEEILRAAEKHHADIIVMGTHGRTGIDRIIFGSVAEKVVTAAPCPVLTVKPRPTEP